MPDDPDATQPSGPPRVSSDPGPTPTGYQRTTGGKGFKWQPPTPDQLAKLLPQYHIEALIGRGGMGAVYKGMQKALERPVAIKILPPEVDDEDASYTERFKNEAKIMARLEHPAIVPVYDFGETGEGQFYFVMGFVDGTDIHQMIQSQGRLPPEYALAITAHVCDALQYAHSHGVVHRDIKPSNVLINMEGQVKVADFGLAKSQDTSLSSGLTKTGLAMGTPDYVAPETLMLGVQTDGRVDLYAVGVMLYQMLTGRIPRGSFDPPSKLAGCDPRFDPIVFKAMKYDREERYPTATDLRRDLDVIMTAPLVQTGGQASAAIPVAQVAEKPKPRSAGAPARRPASPKPGESTRAPEAPPKSKTPLFLGLAATAVIAIGAFVMLGSGSRQNSSTANAPASTPPSRTPACAPAGPVPQPHATTPPSKGHLERFTPTSGGTPPKTSNNAKTTEPTAKVPSATQEKESATSPLSILPPPQPVQAVLPLKIPARPSRIGQIVVWRVDGKPMGSEDAPMLPEPDAAASVQVSAGGTEPGTEFAAALQADGTVQVWGKIAKPPAEVRDIVHVAASASRVLAINTQGAFFAWGSWSDKNDFISRLEQGRHKVVQIATGAGYDFLLTDQGRVMTRSSLAAHQSSVEDNSPFQALVNGSGRAGAVTMNGHFLELRTPNNQNPNLKPVPFLRAPANGYALNHEAVIAVNDGTLVGALPEAQASNYLGVTRIEGNSSRIQGWLMADGKWKFFTSASKGTIDVPHCEKQAEGCFDIALAGDYGFGLKALEQDSVVSTAPAAISNPKPTLSNTDPAAFPPGQWVKVFTKFEDLTENLRKPHSALRWEDGWIRFHADKPNRVYAVDDLTNYGIRAKFLRTNDTTRTSVLMIRARHPPEIAGYLLSPSLTRGELYAARRVEGEVSSPERFWTLSPPAITLPPEGGEYTLEWCCVGDKLIARFDETFVKVITDSTLSSGPGYFTGNTDLRDIEVINLDGLPEAEALRLLGVDEKGNDLRALAAQQEQQQAEQAKVVDAMSAIPELKALHEQFVKLRAERVTAPFEAEVAKLNTSYLGGLDRAIGAEKAAGHLDGVIALEKEKQIVAAVSNRSAQSLESSATSMLIPTKDDEQTPPALKGLRQIYRDSFEKIEATRVANLKALTDPLDTRLKQLETDLTRQDRVEHAKTVREYRDGLGRAAGPPAASNVPGAADSANTAPDGPGTPLPATTSNSSSGDDRAAALMILGKGGKVRYEEGREIKEVSRAEDLPKGSFSVVDLRLELPAGPPSALTELDMQTLSGLKKLERLSVSNATLSDASLAVLGSMLKLTYLTLYSTGISDEGMTHLAALDSLTTLGLGQNPALTSAGFQHLTRLKNVRELYLSNLPKLDEAALSAVQNMRQLQKLSVYSCPNAGKAFLEGLAVLPDLRSLAASIYQLEPAVELSRLKVLEKLEVYSGIPAAHKAFGKSALISLTGLKALNHLHLRGMDLTEEHIQFLVKDLPALTSLTLSSVGLPPSGLAVLQDFKISLVQSLQDGRFDDDVLASLIPVKSVKTVGISSGSPVTASGVSAFRKARPDVLVNGR